VVGVKHPWYLVEYMSSEFLMLLMGLVPVVLLYSLGIELWVDFMSKLLSDVIELDLEYSAIAEEYTDEEEEDSGRH